MPPLLVNTAYPKALTLCKQGRDYFAFATTIHSFLPLVRLVKCGAQTYTSSSIVIIIRCLITTSSCRVGGSWCWYTSSRTICMSCQPSCVCYVWYAWLPCVSLYPVFFYLLLCASLTLIPSKLQFYYCSNLQGVSRSPFASVTWLVSPYTATKKKFSIRFYKNKVFILV